MVVSTVEITTTIAITSSKPLI